MGTSFDRVMREQGRRGVWMAEQTGVTPGFVTLVAQGKRKAPAEFRRRAAIALGVSEAELFPEAETAAA